jgi:preprotein translocase subunit SecA
VLEKNVVLQVIDNHWKQHLSNMDHLRQSVHLRGYAQKDPRQEFKRESFELFAAMLDEIQYEVTGMLLRVQIKTPEEIQKIEEERAMKAQLSLRSMHFNHADLKVVSPAEAPDRSIELNQEELKSSSLELGHKIGRNDPCPCGSGKKYKQCHGAL